MKLFMTLTTIGFLSSGLFAEAKVQSSGIKIQNLSTFASVVDVNETNSTVSDVKNGTRDVIVTIKGCLPTSTKDLLIVQSGTETDVNYTLVEKRTSKKSNVDCITKIDSFVRLQFLVSPSRLGTLHL